MASNVSRPQDDGPGDLSPRRRMENLVGQLRERMELIGESEAIRLHRLVEELALLIDGSGRVAIDEWATELEALLLGGEAEASALCERIEALILECKKAAEAK